MRPAHPCPLCGHESSAACESVSASLPIGARIRCAQCADDCVSGISAGGVAPGGPVPSPPSAPSPPGVGDVTPPPRS